MVRRLGRVAASLALGAGLLLATAACGGGAPTAPPGGAGGANAAASTGSAAAFFKGRIITFVVPHEVGGGFDSSARLLAPYLAKYTGARVEVENRPGAGGIVGQNLIYTAKPDGLTIGIINGWGALAAQVAGAQGVRYDMDRYSWLGRYYAIGQVVVANAKSDLHSFADLVALSKRRQVCFAANGFGSSGYLSAEVLVQATGLHARVVTGFSGHGEKVAALLQNSCDVFDDDADTVVPNVRSGQLRPILTLDNAPTQFFPDVPLVSALPVSPDGTKLLDSLYAMTHAGRLVAAPPGVPADRLAFLRSAFEKALKDPDFVAKAKKASQPITYVPGDQVTGLFAAVKDMPPSMKQLLAQSFKKH